MEQARLEVELREGSGKGLARATRRSGYVPGILYGHKQAPLSIKMLKKGLRSILHSGGENVLINMDIKGSVSETVMLKEIQVDPATRDIMHADFMRVSLEELITTHVPIMLVGTAPGVKEGGVLEFLIRELRIECQAIRMPEHIELDISSLNIGDQIRVADIKLEDEITVHDDPVTIIATVVSPTVLKEAAEEEETVDEEKEPEVIERRREEEEEG